MESMHSNQEYNERIYFMNAENNILLKLTDLLEREKLISAEERNRAVMLIRQEENT